MLLPMRFVDLEIASASGPCGKRGIVNVLRSRDSVLDALSDLRECLLQRPGPMASGGAPVNTNKNLTVKTVNRYGNDTSCYPFQCAVLGW